MFPKSLLSKLICAIATLLLCACSGGSSDDPSPTPPDSSEPQIVPLEKVGRTVLVYMVGNCDLGNSYNHFDSDDLEEMELLSSSPLLQDSRLVVYHHPYRQDPMLKLLTADGFSVLKEYDGTEYSVSAARMTEVIADVQRILPADRFGLVLWSHSTAWVQDGLAEQEAAVQSPLKSFGNDRERSMNITTLARVLEGRGFDYIYFDCCHMANVETLYELRRCADYFVGSTTIDPGEGMPYFLTMPHLLAYDADCVEAARSTFEYFDAMEGVDRSCTMSVVDASALDRLAQAAERVFRSGFYLSPDYYVQQYEISTVNCRFYDLEDYLTHGTTDQDALADFNEALSQAVVYKANTPSIWGNYLPIRTHCGLSTFILKEDIYSSYRGYDQLQWWSDVVSHQFD